MGFIDWLRRRARRGATPAEAHRRFTLLRLRFNIILSHFDIFSEALSQRSEADAGVWLAGLDVVSRDALELPGVIDAPPVMCYLARGPGAAIRRARTRLPGGDPNPVAIIRVPRERMVGTGIASSLVHEVGHQGAALLDLVASLREDLADARDGRLDANSWGLWRRWISEIVADLWSIARLGPASTAGLIGVVSLPAAFVFRIDTEDPHPSPYIRVKLSAAIGDALYPHPQWRRLSEMWESFYDVRRLPAAKQELFEELEETMPAFIERLLEPPAPDAGGPLAVRGAGRPRSPARSSGRAVRRLASAAGADGERGAHAVFAVLGQARLDGRLTPEAESELLGAAAPLGLAQHGRRRRRSVAVANRTQKSPRLRPRRPDQARHLPGIDVVTFAAFKINR